MSTELALRAALGEVIGLLDDGLPVDARRAALAALRDDAGRTDTYESLHLRAAKHYARAISAEEAVARVKALCAVWESIHDTIAPVLGHPPRGEVRAHAVELRAALTTGASWLLDIDPGDIRVALAPGSDEVESS